MKGLFVSMPKIVVYLFFDMLLSRYVKDQPIFHRKMTMYLKEVSICKQLIKILNQQVSGLILFI